MKSYKICMFSLLYFPTNINSWNIKISFWIDDDFKIYYFRIDVYIKHLFIINRFNISLKKKKKHKFQYIYMFNQPITDKKKRIFPLSLKKKISKKIYSSSLSSSSRVSRIEGEKKRKKKRKFFSTKPINNTSSGVTRFNSIV